LGNSSDRIRAVRNSGLLDAKNKTEFDDIIEVVKAGLNCPVALVSILDEHRQVFLAHLGLPEKWAEAAETPLTHSFCQHVVRDKQPLIIGDATLHDLVRDNLAITDLGVISYMGVPVTLPDGMVIGALAAIDGEPRVWTDAELETLSRIGKIVSNQIATFLAERRPDKRSYSPYTGGRAAASSQSRNQPSPEEHDGDGASDRHPDTSSCDGSRSSRGVHQSTACFVEGP